jgi:ABC-type branched-subunit amino acid transport system ATPase component
MPYTVNASGITNSFGGHLALDHVDLAIGTGSVFALLGPNGAGNPVTGLGHSSASAAGGESCRMSE